MVRLELRLLGPFEVRLDGNAVTGFESNKVRALLAYLAAESPRPQSRESLAELLWPGWPQQSAMSNLRYALSDLRKTIGDREVNPHFLIITREIIQLNPESQVWVDALALNKSIAQLERGAYEDFQGAMDHYHGPFMENFSLAENTDFSDWLLSRRAFYQHHALQCLRLLASRYEKIGEYELGLKYARQQLEIEPWLEEGHQQMMRLLTLSGQISAALAQYEECKRLLRKEVGVDPSEETCQLYHAITNGDLRGREASPSHLPSPPHPLHNLSHQLTRFFGRKAEIEQFCHILRDGQFRLVTLTGAGGVGKSRLALQVGEALLDHFSNGVWLVEVAPLSDPLLVMITVAQHLEVPVFPGQPIQETLLSYLQNKCLLIILDNCEHLLEECARLVELLLKSCSQIQVIATSREILGLAGETSFRVPSLSLPDPARLPEREQIEEYEAVQLFTDRARQAAPGFSLDEITTKAVASICQRLDGIPLAIELAAARMRMMDTETLAARLEDGFSLLSGGNRTALPRQQTLRATLDWSYHLMAAEERLLLQRLSIFAGGCTLAAAETICAGEGLAQSEVLDLLAALVDKSMVIAERQEGSEMRYRLLEMVRQYAFEKLAEAGESERLYRRHQDYFVQFAETNSPKLIYKERTVWFKIFDAEYANLRMVLERAFTHITDVDAGPRLAVALNPYMINPFGSEERLIQSINLVQNRPDVSPAIFALLLGWGSVWLGNSNWAQQGLAISRGLGEGEKETLCWSLLFVINDNVDYQKNLDQTQALLEEQAVLIQSLGSEAILDPRIHQAFHMDMLAELSFKRKQYERARVYALESIRLFQAFAHAWMLLLPYQLLGALFLQTGEYDQARNYYIKALHLAIEYHDARQVGYSAGLSEAEFCMGNLSQAFAYCKDSLQLAYEKGHTSHVLRQVEMAAKIFAKQGRFAEAARLSGAATALIHQFDRKIPVEPSQDALLNDAVTQDAKVSLDILVPDWRTRLDSEMILAAWNEGQAMSYDQAITYVLAGLSIFTTPKEQE